MSKKQTQVPKFGNWDASDYVPFTVVFEKARADKGAGIENKTINPNDPSENPTLFGRKTDSHQPSGRSSQQQFLDHFGLREDPGHGGPHANGGYLRSTVADHSKNGSIGSANDNGGAGFGEDNQSAEQSSSHSRAAVKGRLGNRFVPSSLSPDKKGSPEGGALHHQPAHGAKSRFRRGSQGVETPDGSAVLPKFGNWDVKDPTAGEGYTVIFNHARREKKVGGPAHIPSLQSESPASTDLSLEYKKPQYPIQRKTTTWACCFQAPNAE